MFTAKFTKTEETPQGTRFYVDFTDGTTTVSEFCVPQDEHGFNHWVESRKAALTTAAKLKDTLTVGQDITIEKPVKEVIEPTAEDIAFATWVENNRALENAEKLVERSTKHGLEIDPLLTEQIKALAETVNSTFKPEYIRKI